MKLNNRFPIVSWLDYGLWGSSYLKFFFNQKISILNPIASTPNSIRIGWGKKASGLRAVKFAKATGQPCWLLEDGFLRSLGLGVQGAKPLSIVIDDLGIYYDATTPSRLEKLISNIVMSEERMNQALRAMNLIRLHHLSKYNLAPDLKLSPSTKTRVLVVDQTFNDSSVRGGGADASTFKKMLTDALLENPDAEIWVKTHPDVISGKKKGYLPNLPEDSRLYLCTEDVSPLSLLEQMDKVYVVTSQMGFEALILKKPVVCFGRPWYAGWGLTDDRHKNMAELKDRRSKKHSLEELFYAAYFQYPLYLKPSTGKAGTIFDVIDYLAINRKLIQSAPCKVYCVGMSLWKRAIVKPFLENASTKVHFVSTPQKIPEKAIMVSWGIKYEDEKKAQHWRMEDGFIRSVGLGSDLNRPVSLVLDRGGMYYDPSSDSDLQKILENQKLSPEELLRVKCFKEIFVSERLSKYNLARSQFVVSAPGKKIILVPGQVEDDASIKQGSPVVKTNLALLQAVRAANPEAFILYKPHPDVVAGNRIGNIDSEQLQKLANQVVAEANIIDCIQASHEIHTMTSQAGFEALLHGKIVHCYGGPFYAGRGLTIDHFSLPMRKRKVSLEEMIFAAVLEYPRYAIPGVPGLVSAENVLEWLALQASQYKAVIPTSGLAGWLGRKVRKLRALKQLLWN